MEPVTIAIIAVVIGVPSAIASTIAIVKAARERRERTAESLSPEREEPGPAATPTPAAPAPPPADDSPASATEAPPTPASTTTPEATTLPIFSVPYARNPNFTGRTSQLRSVHGALTRKRAAALTQAFVGLGGIGKTQLALEYAYKHRDDYQVVWWVASEEPAQLAAEYGALAVRLELIGAGEPDQRKIVAAARGWLEANGRWLLIFDNVPDRDAIYECLPRGGSGHVLITSRNQALGQVAETVDVPKFPRRESIAFLKKRTGQEEGADDLAEEVGDLPLALEQAAAYVEATGCTLGDYADLFRTRREVLWEGQRPPLGYSETVGTTWAVAMEKLQEEESIATEVLNLLAFLAPDDIPRDLLSKVMEDSAVLNRAIAALRRYSLVKVETDGETLSVHRLVQAVTRDRMSEEEGKKWAGVAVRLLNAAFPFEEEDPTTWEGSSRLLPHALTAAEHAAESAAADDVAPELLKMAGWYLCNRAEFSGARTACERAVVIAERVCAPDAPRLASCVGTLGYVLYYLGDRNAARQYFERALEIDERAYGPDHPTVARRVNNLGGVLQNLGDLEGARAHYERALEIDERAYGPDHPTVAAAANNLGDVLRTMGDLEGGKAHFERALSVDEKTYGPDHPRVASCVTNLGNVLLTMGDLEGAKAHIERGLAIFEKTYGEDHPHVAIAAGSLGSVLQSMGDLAGAKAHYERALSIDEKTYGPDHPDVATDVNNLGSVAFQEGDLEEAGRCARRALDIDEKVYGAEHPQVALRLNNLGHVAEAKGEVEEARKHFERALVIYVNFLGEDHPNTQLVRRNLEGLDKK